MLNVPGTRRKPKRDRLRRFLLERLEQRSLLAVLMVTNTEGCWARVTSSSNRDRQRNE